MLIFSIEPSAKPDTSATRSGNIGNRFISFQGSPRIQGESTPLSGLVDCIFVALAYGDDQHDQSTILDFVDEPVADTAQLDFVAIRVPRQLGGG